MGVGLPHALATLNHIFLCNRDQELEFLYFYMRAQGETNFEESHRDFVVGVHNLENTGRVQLRLSLLKRSFWVWS